MILCFSYFITSYLYIFIFKNHNTLVIRCVDLNQSKLSTCFWYWHLLIFSDGFYILELFSPVSCVFRLAGQTASRVVSLFLDGDVSFLPDNSFPSHLQLLKVGILLEYYCPSIRFDCFYSDLTFFLVPEKCDFCVHCLFRRSQVTLGDSHSWSVCSWHVCARYLAVWVKTS